MSIMSCFASAASAQEPIRIQANEVNVPVFVTDQRRVDAWARKVRDNVSQAIFAGQAQSVDRMLAEILTPDLHADDFQLTVDENRQTILRIAYQRSLYWDVRDNFGHHTEYIGPGEGKWSTNEWPAGLIGDLAAPHYVIIFARPEPQSGTCHQIKITVNRRNAFTVFRSQYCDIATSSSDPLDGTSLGNQLQKLISEERPGDFEISVGASVLYSDHDSRPVHISVDWPWKAFKADSESSKAIVGAVINKDGTVVARFSDLADRVGYPVSTSGKAVHFDSGIWSHKPFTSETRYDGQVDLPPGEYELAVVLGDGIKFGRSRTGLTVDWYDKKVLSISPLSICKQVSDVSANAFKLSGAWTETLPGNLSALISSGVEFKPTSNTRFKASEKLYLYFEIYRPLLNLATPAVEFQVRIADAKTGELRSDVPVIDATPYAKPGSPIIAVGRGLDISKLPIGSYRVEVRAVAATNTSTDWRGANFSVK